MFIFLLGPKINQNDTTAQIYHNGPKEKKLPCSLLVESATSFFLPTPSVTMTFVITVPNFRCDICILYIFYMPGLHFIYLIFLVDMHTTKNAIDGNRCKSRGRAVQWDWWRYWRHFCFVQFRTTKLCHTDYFVLTNIEILISHTNIIKLQ